MGHGVLYGIILGKYEFAPNAFAARTKYVGGPVPCSIWATSKDTICSTGASLVAASLQRTVNRIHSARLAAKCCQRVRPQRA